MKINVLKILFETLFLTVVKPGVTVVDTFAPSHCVVSAAKAGIAATDTEIAKCWKYNDFDNYCF